MTFPFLRVLIKGKRAIDMAPIVTVSDMGHKVISYIEPQSGDLDGEVVFSEFIINVKCKKDFLDYSSGKTYSVESQDKEHIWISDNRSCILPITYEEFEEYFEEIQLSDLV